jgi:hypothetical protein
VRRSSLMYHAATQMQKDLRKARRALRIALKSTSFSTSEWDGVTEDEIAEFKRICKELKV